MYSGILARRILREGQALDCRSALTIESLSLKPLKLAMNNKGGSLEISCPQWRKLPLDGSKQVFISFFAPLAGRLLWIGYIVCLFVHTEGCKYLMNRGRESQLRQKCSSFSLSPISPLRSNNLRPRRTFWAGAMF